MKVSCSVPPTGLAACLLKPAVRPSSETREANQGFGGPHAKLFFLVSDFHGRKRQSGRGEDVHRQEKCTLQCAPTSTKRGQRACPVLVCFRHTLGEYTTLRVSLRLSSRKCFKRVLVLTVARAPFLSRTSFPAGTCVEGTNISAACGVFQACVCGASTSVLFLRVLRDGLVKDASACLPQSVFKLA